MRLYILRHGNSPSVIEAKVSSDSERPLSAKGRGDIRKVIAELLKRGGKPALILHSPLRRAVETAGEAAGLTGAGAEPYEPLSNILGGPELYSKLKARLAGVEETLVVGHQPQLGELAAFLAKGRFALSPGGLVGIEIGTGSSTLLWSYNPEDLPK